MFIPSSCSEKIVLIAAVEALVQQSGLPDRTHKWHFSRATATAMAPIAYVQRLRIEEATRRLERTDLSIDEISWTVGYEEPAFFRRLFKRLTPSLPASIAPVSSSDFARPRSERLERAGGYEGQRAQQLRMRSPL